MRTILARNWLDNTRSVDIELTTYCDVGCIACARINNELYDVHSQVWKKVFTSDIHDLNIVQVRFTSKWGDPLSHPDFLDILDVLYEQKSDVTVIVETSFHYHDQDFYKKLARSLRRFEDCKVSTHVYGTGDLHQKFRKNSSFDKVKTHTQVLTKMRVFVYWAVPTFQYNQDDVPNILSNAVISRVGGLSTREFWGEVWKLDTEPGYTEGAPLPDWLQKADDGTDIDEDWGRRPFIEPVGNEDYLDDCQSLFNQSVWIDPWGGVWPCYALGKYSMETNDIDGKIIDKTVDHYGVFNNVNNNSLKDILQHKWYTSDLPNSQETKPWEACKKECNICDRKV